MARDPHPKYFQKHLLFILHKINRVFCIVYYNPCVCGGGGGGCGGGAHRGTGVNILFETGQYPHNSSYDAPCLP